MVTNKAACQEPIRLHFESLQQVVVTPADNDRFVTTAREAAHACRVAEDAKVWREEFLRFLLYLHLWCARRATVVSRCFVGVSDEGLRVFILTKGRDFRFDFADEISDLDLRLVQEFPRCRTTVIQLPESPPESLSSFVSFAEAIEAYGE